MRHAFKVDASVLVTFLCCPNHLNDAGVANELSGYLNLLSLVGCYLASAWKTAIFSSRAICGLSNHHISLKRCIAHSYNAPASERGCVDPPSYQVTRAWSCLIVHGASFGAAARTHSQSRNVNVLSFYGGEKFHILDRDALRMSIVYLQA